MPMKVFIDQYLCPSMRLALSGFCVGRDSECLRCGTMSSAASDLWSYTKCKPNRNLAAHEICSNGKF